jgi:hypothetical protein
MKRGVGSVIILVLIVFFLGLLSLFDSNITGASIGVNPVMEEIIDSCQETTTCTDEIILTCTEECNCINETKEICNSVCVNKTINGNIREACSLECNEEIIETCDYCEDVCVNETIENCITEEVCEEIVEEIIINETIEINQTLENETLTILPIVNQTENDNQTIIEEDLNETINQTFTNESLLNETVLEEINSTNSSNLLGINELGILSLSGPVLNFTLPTPASGTNTTNTSVEINISITEQDLDQVIYNWNGTNFTMYNDSLVLMYNFDNVSALGENDTYVFDVSGNNNNGTTVGEAIYASSGKYGGAFDFDGVNDELTTSSTFGIVTTNFSISTWVNLDSASEGGAFVKIGGTSPNQGFGIGVGGTNYDDTGNDLILLYEGVRWIDTNDLIGTGWHHVVMTVDSSGYPEAFLDGVSVYSDSTGAGTAPQQSITYIGGYTGSGAENRHADTTIDEVRIWNKTLSADEIYQHYISNLKQIDANSWELYVNQSKNATNELDNGTYTYQTFATDDSSNENSTETRTVVVNTTVVAAVNSTLSLDWIYPTININATQHELFNVTVNVSCFDANCEEVNVSLDPAVGTEYNFSTCTSTDKDGPSQDNCDTNYTGTPLAGQVTINTQGIQEWTVPSSGTYKLEGYGAKGGGPRGGNGAYVSGEFSLTAGETIYVIVGQRGNVTSQGDYGAGGGGASYIYRSADAEYPLLVAAGGGGQTQNHGGVNEGYGGNGSATTDPTNGTGSGSGPGGANGNGGSGGLDVGSFSTAGGGAGWLTNGSDGLTIREPKGIGGMAPRSGATGGNTTHGSYIMGDGGFGGGGSMSDNSGAGGGGGGYNGGGGGNNYAATSIWGSGGGGGSYNSGDNQNGTTGINTNGGYVIITVLSSGKSGLITNNSSATPFYTNGTNPFNVSLNAGESQTITWWVNATGTIDIDYEFFVYANQTSNMSVANETSRLNITIIDTTAPVVAIAYPTATVYDINVTELNYTYTDLDSSGSCWYSDDNGDTNSSTSNAGTDFTGLSSSAGSNTWAVYCNDTSGNFGSDSVTFNSSVPSVGLTLITPTAASITNGVNVTANKTFTVSTSVSCSNNDCGEINVTLNTSNSSAYNVTITSNPSNVTLNNGGSGTITWTINATGDTNTTSEFFVYANKTSDMSIRDETTHWNVTIVNYSVGISVPSVSTTYPVSSTNYVTNVSELNYSVSVDPLTQTLDKCWYSTDSGATNSSNVSAGVNFSSLTSTAGSNTWTVYCNDNNSLVGSSFVTFSKVPKIGLNMLYPTGDVNVTLHETFSVLANVSCDNVNCGEVNTTLMGGSTITYTSCQDALDSGQITNGTYNICPTDECMDVYCDMSNGGSASIFQVDGNLTLNNTGCNFSFSNDDHDGYTMWKDYTLKLATANIVTTNTQQWYTWNRDGTEDTSAAYLPDNITGQGTSARPVQLPAVNKTIWFDWQNTRIMWDDSNITFSSVGITGDGQMDSYSNNFYFITDGINQIHAGYSGGTAVVLTFDFNNNNVSSQSATVLNPTGGWWATEEDSFGHTLWTVNGRVMYYKSSGVFVLGGNLTSPNTGASEFPAVSQPLSPGQPGLDFFGRVDDDGFLWLVDWGHDNGGYFNCGNDNQLGNGQTNIALVSSSSSTQSSSEVVSLNTSTTPFYTTTNNPYNVSLNDGDSETITWTVNATGDVNSTYEFFSYSNWTSDMDVSNTTSLWNVTIVDFSVSPITIAYPTSGNKIVNISELNYTFLSDYSLDQCWYSTDDGATNSSLVSPGTNFSGVSSAVGSNTWTVYCNDTFGLDYSKSVTFSKVPLISLEIIYPSASIQSQGVNVTQNEMFNVLANVSCSNVDCGEINVSLDPATSTIYNFTTCGATGRAGPSQDNCDTNYTGTTLAGLVDVGGGIQNWTVPTTGTYTIETAGAVGGLGTATYSGGLGARMTGTFELTAGQVIQVLVGQSGEDWVGYKAGGGGGGSFVVLSNDDPLIIAGGGGAGGGNSNPASGQSGLNETSGGTGSQGVYAGGTNGGGGSASSGTFGGAGFSGNGGTSSCTGATPLSFLNGGTGGQAGTCSASGGDGGFGGGSGGEWCCQGACGAGGGYSGGGGTDSNGVAGGGGSVNNGTNQNNTAGVNTAEGYVSITFTGGAKNGVISTNTSATPFYTTTNNPYNVSLNAGQSETITWTVNATGDANTTHEFFTFANWTSDMDISNVTSIWNVTIVDFSVSPITIDYPTSGNKIVNISELNYTLDTNSNLDQCWYSTNNGAANSSLVSPGTNFSSISSAVGSNTWIVYCNDTFGLYHSKSITFSKVPIIGLTMVRPTGNVNVTLHEIFNVLANVSCSNVDCGEINVSLDPASETVYNFTTCGATGVSGPSQDNCDTNYTGTSLAGLVTVGGGIQNFTVPTTGTYVFETVGAGGGSATSYTSYPGRGAVMNGTISLTAGQVIQILVGQKGVSGTTEGGGGGGSFVVDSNNDPLMIAGGGAGTYGGDSNRATYADASNESSGRAGEGTSTGGTLGNGGSAGASGNGASGGGGLTGDGGNGYSTSVQGLAFVNGGTGGAACSSGTAGAGGFGGGAGSEHCYYGSAGGGGGYSGGGGGGTSSASGGGGGSINNGTIQDNVGGVNSGDGYVTITFTGSVKSGLISTNTSATPFYTTTNNPYNVSLNARESETITWTVNATGDINSTYEFFSYSNWTSNTDINNKTSIWNVTIVDFSVSPITIGYPVSGTDYLTDVTQLNYTLESGYDFDQCWYSTDAGATNSTLVSPGTNFSSISSSGSSNTWIVYCNDTLGLEYSRSVTFSRIPFIGLTMVSPLTDVNVTQNDTFTVSTTVSCNNVDCGEINVSLDPASDAETIQYDDFKSNFTDPWYDDAVAYAWSRHSGGTSSSSTGPSSAYSGTYYIYVETSSGSCYTNGQTAIVYQTPAINFNSYSDEEISWYNNMYGSNIGVLELQENTTGSWVTLWTESGNQGTSWFQNTTDLSSLSGFGNLRFYYTCAGGYTGDVALDVINISGVTSSSTKSGLISMNSTATPFATSTQNPYNLSLNAGESETITWTVNSTGDTNTTHEFFVYANWTSDQSISNETTRWNITILENGSYTGVDFTAPAITFVLSNNSYSTDIGLDIDYTVYDLNLSSCWYSNDSMSENISLGDDGNCTNITSIVWTEGQHNLTIWANDSLDNNGSSSLTFTIDTTIPNGTLIAPGDNTYNTTNATQNFTINLTDNLGVKNATLYLYNSSGSLISKLTTILSESVLSSYIGTIVTLADGVYTWFYKLFDWAGNSFTTANYTVTVDASYPSLTIISPTNNTYTTNSNLDINYTASDFNLSSCWYSNDSMSENISLGTEGNCNNITSIVWADDEHNLTIWVNDSGGYENSSTITFTMDFINPNATLISPENNTFNTPASQNFTVNLSDNIGIKNATVYIYNSSNELTNQTTNADFAEHILSSTAGIVVSLIDDNYTWYYDVFDWAGNYYLSTNNTIIIDATAPVLNVTSFVNNTYTNNTGLNINYTVSDTYLDSCWYSNDSYLSNTTLSPCQTNITTVTWSEGQHNLTIWANDSAGNENYILRRFTIDFTNPNGTLIAPGNNTYNTNASQNLTINLTDNIGVKNATLYVYNSSGSLIETITTIFSESVLASYIGNLVTLADGVYTWFYELFDWAGNSFTTSNNTITIDTTTPLLNIISPTNNTYTNNTGLNINYTVSDTYLDSCWYSNDSYLSNTTLSPCQTNITTVTWSEGQHNLTIWANDTANNQNSSSITFAIDLTNPAINIDTPSNNSDSNDSGLDVTYTVTDTNAESCWYSNDSWSSNTTLASCTTDITAVTWSDGQHNVSLWVNDSAGHGNSTDITFTIDSINPSLSIATPSNNTFTDNTGLNINYSTSDTNLDSCWYSNDSFSSNTTLASCANITDVTWSEGQHNIMLWVNDTYENENNTDVTFTIDTYNPMIEFIDSTFTNAITTDNTSIGINVSITETNLDEVIYNWNGTNYTMYNDSLVLMMNFDNVSNLGEDDTHVLDVSGNGNNGTGTGVILNTTDCKFGNCFLYGGDGDNIDIGAIPELQSKNVFTVSFWAWDDDYSASPGTVAIWDGNVDANNLFLFYPYDNVNGNGTRIWYNGVSLIDENDATRTGWNHFVFVSRSATDHEIYVNGVSEGTSSTSKSLPASITNVNIGMWYTGSSQYFDGLLDELYIWNHSLSSDEVYQQYISNLNKFNSTQWYLYVNQSKNATDGLNDSTYTYQTFATDKLNNLNQTEQRTVTVSQAIGPTLTINSPTTNSFSTNTGLDVTYTVTSVTLDSCWYNDNSGSNTTLTSCANITSVTWDEGEHNVTIYANDTNGESTATVTFTVDTINPTFAIQSPIDNSYTTNSTIHITYSSSDTNSESCWYSNDSLADNTTLADCNTNITSLTWSEGQHTVYIWTNDSAGNLNSSSVTFTIDTITPSLSISTPTNNTFSNDTNLNVNYSASDTNLESCWYANDSLTTNTTLSNCANLTGIEWSEQQHTVYLWVNDSAGNQNQTDVTFTTDTSSLIINISTPSSNYYSTDTSLDVNYTILGDNIEDCWYSNDSMLSNTSFSTCGDNITSITWSEGQHNVTIYANDSVGEVSSSSMTFTIDTITPSLSISTPTNNTYTNNNGLDVNYTATDTNLDSCWYANDSLTINTTLSNCANLTGIEWSEQQHTIYLWANDYAGNKNQTDVTFTIDTTYPTWSDNKTNLATDVSLGSSVYFNITLSDTNPDQYIFSWYNGTDWVNDSATSYTNGEEISINKTINNQNVDINWTWYFNDTTGNLNQTDVWNVVLYTTPTISLSTIYPLASINVSQNEWFNVTVNITCNGNDCDDVNVTLDPETITVVTLDGFEEESTCSSSCGVSCSLVSTNWSNIVTEPVQTRDWVSDKGGTSSSSTGPSVDHTLGNSNGYYLYTESSSSCNFDEYHLVSLPIDTNTYSNLELNFWYHMYGSTMGTLHVDVNESGSWVNDVWNASGNLGNTWFNATVDLSSYTGTINIRFRGITGSSYTSDMAIDDINITSSSSAKGGIISTTPGTIPFYTNITNPYNLSLNQSQSQIITWYVNATGETDIAHEFFVYANKTTDLSINNITSKWNVTIKDTTSPTINITYPLSVTYDVNIIRLDYTYSDFNGDGSCWYSNSSGVWNSTSVVAGINFTNVSTIEGENNFSVYCNDSSGNLNSETVTFTKNIPEIGISLVYPTTNLNVFENDFFNVTANVSCSNNDCGEINVSLDPPTDRTLRTCSGVWGASCVGADPTTSDYSYDSCSSGSYYSTGFWVDEVTVDATTVAIGDTINITCNYDCYSTSSYNDLAISYYNGTWNTIWSQDASCTDGDYSTQVNVSGNLGEQYVRCQIGYTNSNPTGTCFTTQYSDNDDVNFTVVASGKNGLVSTIVGDTPFYTNGTNPYNLTLNENESQIITWNVNATGDLNSTHEFFVYVNKTADLSISNITETINITIVSVALPTINFESQTTANGNYSQSYIVANVSASETNFANLTVYLYNSSGIYNSSNSSSSEHYVLFSNLPDGTYYLNATTENTFGTKNSVGTRIITLDTLAPSLEIISPIDNYNVSSSSLNFTFTATEISTTNCSIYSDQEGLINYILRDSNSSITSGATTTLSISNLGERVHNWYIICNDTVGNTNTSTTRQFTVDNGPPTITLSSPVEDSSAGSLVYIYTDISDSLNSIDQASYAIFNATELSQSLANGSLNSTNNWDSVWNSSSYGEVEMNLTLIIYANDTSGNLVSKNVTFRLDNVNPVIQLVEPSELLTYYNSNFSLNAIVQDLSLNYTNYSISSDSIVQQNSSSYGTPTTLHNWNDLVNINNYSDGSYNLTVFGSDINSNSKTVSTLFIIDNTAPQLTLHNPTGTYSNSSSVLFNFTVLDNISSTLDCNITAGVSIQKIDCVNSSNCNYTFTGFLDLSYNYSIYCKDNASNVVGYSSNITIDTTNPEIEFTSQTSSGNLSQNNIIINVSVVDQNLANITNYLYNSIGSLINSSSSSSTPLFNNFTGLESGTYYFNSTTTDLANNSVSTIIRSVVLDVIPPSNILNASDTDLQKNVDSVTIDWASSDNSGSLGTSSINTLNQGSLSTLSSGDLTITSSNLNTVTLNITYPNGLLLFNSSSTSGEIVFDPNNLTIIGNYLVSLYSVDAAGNYNLTNLTILVNDTTVPTVELINPMSGNYAQEWIFVNVTSTDEDVNTIDIYLYNSTPSLVEQSGGFSSPYSYNFTSLTDGTYYYNASVCDSNQCNNSDAKTVLLDTTGPEMTLNYPAADYVNSSSNLVSVLFNCSANDSIGLANTSLYLTNNQNNNLAFNQSTNISGTLNSTIWNVNLSPGNYNWNCLGVDSLGNTQFASENSIIFINFTDTDNDGIKDEEDLLKGNESNVIKSGINNLNITVSGNSTYGSYDNVQELIFYDSAVKLLNFTHNFTSTELNLSKVTLIKTDNSILINISGQLQDNYNKTIYLENNEFVSLCAKDAEISSISEVSSSCNGDDETDLTSCLTTNITVGYDNTTNTTNLIGCKYDGTTFSVSNLRNSALRGTLVASDSDSSSSSGGSGSNGGGGGGAVRITEPESIGEEDYECYTHDDCTDDKACFYHQCVKLFDIKILEVDSPIGSDGYMGFTYFIKGMADFNNDVIIDFWLEKDGEEVSSGKDTIYIGSFEEKTESTKIFVPKTLDDGTYNFYIQVSYENYAATAKRTVYVEVTEDGIKANLIGQTIMDSAKKILFDLSWLWISIVVLLIFVGLGWKYKSKLNDRMILIGEKNTIKSLKHKKRKENDELKYKLLARTIIKLLKLRDNKPVVVKRKMSFTEEKKRRDEKRRNRRKFFHDYFGMFKTDKEKQAIRREKERKIARRKEEKLIEKRKKRAERLRKEKIIILGERRLFTDEERRKQESKKNRRKFFHDYFGMFKTDKEKEDIQRAKEQRIAKKRSEKRKRKEEKLRKKNLARAKKLREERKIIFEENKLYTNEERRKQERRRNRRKFFHDHFGMFKTDKEKRDIIRAKERKIAHKKEEKLRKKQNAEANISRRKREKIARKKKVRDAIQRRKQEVKRNRRKFFHDHFGMFKTDKEREAIKRAKEQRIARKRSEVRKRKEEKLRKKQNAEANISRRKREKIARKKKVRDAIQRRKQEVRRNRRKFFHDHFGMFKTDKEKQDIQRAKEQRIARKRSEVRKRKEEKLRKKQNAEANISRRKREKIARKKRIRDAIQRRKQEVKRNRRKFFHDHFGMFKTDKEREAIKRAKEQKIANKRRRKELKIKHREEKKIRKQEEKRQQIIIKEKLKQFEVEKREEEKVKEQIESVKSAVIQKRKALEKEEWLTNKKIEAIREEQRKKHQEEEEELRELEEKEEIKKKIEKQKEKIIREKLKKRLKKIKKK